MNFKLTIRYNGTNYSGWQALPDVTSIQGEMQQAIGRIVGAGQVNVVGCGRTDKGVHALGQVAHVHVPTTMSPQTLRDQINRLLPSDIAIVKIERVHRLFNARWNAISRIYLYQFVKGEPSAAVRPFAASQKVVLDIDLIRQILPVFKGRHDFSAFSQADDERDSTKATVLAFDVHPDEQFIIFSLRATRFFWRMARRIIGVTAAVGAGRLSASAVGPMISKPDARAAETAARFTVAAKGLFLYQIQYEGDELAPIPSAPIVIPE
jgi:tRNA pseudouridine38-40 synthase